MGHKPLILYKHITLKLLYGTVSLFDKSMDMKKCVTSGMKIPIFYGRLNLFITFTELCHLSLS